MRAGAASAVAHAEDVVDAAGCLAAACAIINRPMPTTPARSALPPTAAIAIQRKGFGFGCITATPVTVRYMNA